MGSRKLTMRPRLIIALMLSIASISTASILFLDAPSKSSMMRTTSLPSIEIKWGEGSEAGAPEAAAALAANTTSIHADDAYVFAGKCASGEPYRLVAYRKNIAGVAMSHYDYSGPVGTGTVQSETAPKVMAVRICHKSAEIISANYWESR